MRGVYVVIWNKWNEGTELVDMQCQGVIVFGVRLMVNG